MAKMSKDYQAEYRDRLRQIKAMGIEYEPECPSHYTPDKIGERMLSLQADLTRLVAHQGVLSQHKARLKGYMDSMTDEVSPAVQRAVGDAYFYLVQNFTKQDDRERFETAFSKVDMKEKLSAVHDEVCRVYHNVTSYISQVKQRLDRWQRVLDERKAGVLENGQKEEASAQQEGRCGRYQRRSRTPKDVLRASR